MNILMFSPLFKHIENWMFQRLKKTPLISQFDHGHSILLFGKEYRIQYIQGISNRIIIQENCFLIVRTKSSVCVSTLVTKFLKNILYQKVESKSQEYAKKIGVKISKVSVKIMKSRWGSCSSKGNLSYALNLVFAPESMIDYVCAHEVAHLMHMNHSKDFWHCTRLLYPEYARARQWFKENGKFLFTYNLK